MTKPAVRPRRRSPAARLQRQFAAAGVALAGAIGAIQFLPAHTGGVPGPFTRLTASSPAASASPDAFGRSGAVRTLFALPGATIQFPLTVSDPRGLRYRWISLDGHDESGRPVPLHGGRPEAPSAPGFYRLAVTGPDPVAAETVVDAPVLAVMAPFRDKVGGVLNGYRIGTYVAERLRADDVPEGFVEVWPEVLDLQVTANLRLEDFITHDARQETVWPKYVALSPRLLDKLELVIAEVERERPADRPVAVAVRSGFRTPAYNARVERAARDSRHQHGDAADVAIDANGDGRLTAADGQLVARAVDRVERAHPDLAGGLGLYVSRRYRTPYVHIDARGARARWRG